MTNVGYHRTSFMRILQLCALLLLVSFSFSTNTDFYKILGISRRATIKEIKKAYRQKSLEFHPDKNKSEGAAEKFAEISRAYEVLSDETKKEIYDMHGEEGLKMHEGSNAGGGGHGGGFDPFEDFFSAFGFGGHGGGHRKEEGEQTTDSVEVPLRLELSILYQGDILEVEYVRKVLCTNWEDCMKKDNECSGPGVKVRMQQVGPGFVQKIQTDDPRCVARGKSWRSNCKSCPRGKTQNERIELTLDVTKGMRSGERITFEGVTDEKPGFKPGDLHFVIQEIPHDQYNRDGDQLYASYEIPLVDALTGFTLEMIHVDGHKFTVEVNGVTECDHVKRIPGKGMPRRSGRGFGDLYLTFEVDFPDKLTQSQRDGLKKILSRGSDEL